jgi:ATP-binding cassette subfamily G (WHITE) protein 2 (PDR)
MSLVGNYTTNGDATAANHVPPPGAVPPRTAHTNGSDHVGSDTSEASTIAANHDGTRLDHTINNNNHNNIHGSDIKTSAPNATHHTKEVGATDDEAESLERREDAVHQLARRYTQHSDHSITHHNPFNAAEGSALDPHGEHFNARTWTKAMLHTHQEDPQAHPTRTAGVSFRNLNVHGFGSDTDYQKSVGNVWLEGPGLARKLMGNKGRKIEILKNVDGLVEAGEMLVVLGPPGSGCSTFLKTLAGETHGFIVDPNSTMNYQGTSCFIHIDYLTC